MDRLRRSRGDGKVPYRSTSARRAADLAAVVRRKVVRGVGHREAGDDRQADGRGADDVPAAPQRRVDVLDAVAVDRLALQVMLDDRILLHADRDVGGLAELDV